MKLHFYGADRCVTGSCHCLEINGKRILVDCGLQQGRDELDNAMFAFNPGDIDILLVTHAHIDHTGRIPLLVKRGFTGRILTTRVTADLMRIMLLDSAHIQESDAEYRNRKGQRAGREPVEPLYTTEDAMNVFKFLTVCEYGQSVELCEGVTAVFTDAGHLLGSASITLELDEGGVHKTLVFSGDIGNVDQPIIRDPQLLKKADYVVMESTYGDRNHTEVWSYTDELAEIIDETLRKGGNVVIPSFAVGRTQELLYFIREIKDKGLVTSVKDFPVYVDSPLALEATQIYDNDLGGYADADCTVTDDRDIEDAWQRTEASASRARRDAQPPEETADAETDEASEIIREGRAAMRRIRHANDLIPDPELSAQIDSIENSCGQILSVLEQRPQLLSQLRTFLRYYLPTTLRLLEARAKLENDAGSPKAREVRARISQAVGEIDKAFRKQAEALDEYRFIDLESEMDVMRDMLKSDGLIDEDEQKDDDPFADVLKNRNDRNTPMGAH